jgi:hypothetical protein
MAARASALAVGVHAQPRQLAPAENGASSTRSNASSRSAAASCSSTATSTPHRTSSSRCSPTSRPATRPRRRSPGPTPARFSTREGADLWERPLAAGGCGARPPSHGALFARVVGGVPSPTRRTARTIARLRRPGRWRALTMRTSQPAREPPRVGRSPSPAHATSRARATSRASEIRATGGVHHRPPATSRHPQPRQPAQPGRMRLRDPRPAAAQARPLRHPAGSRRADARRHRDPQPDRDAVHVDLRRQGSQRIHSARNHRSHHD